MSRVLSIAIISLTVMALATLPTGKPLLAPDAAYAASGALGPTPPNYTLDTGMYVTGTPPTNYQFETQGGQVGTPPTNHDFETGDFTGWTTSGTVSIQSGGPTGYYAKLDTSGNVYSSPFTVPAQSQSLRVDIGTLGSSTNAYAIYILSGPDYGTSTLVKSASCSSCQGQWSTVEIDPSSWRTQSIKLRVRRTGGSIGVDNAGISVEVLVGWTSYGLVGQPDGPTGKYAELKSGADMDSPAFSFPTAAQTLSFDRVLPAASTAIGVRVATAPDYSTWTPVYSESSGSGSQPWTTKTLNLSQWAGQSIKLRFEGTGTVGVDNAGIMKVALPNWSLNISDYGEVPTVESGGPSGNYARLYGGNHNVFTGAFTVPSFPPELQFRRTFLVGNSSLSVAVMSGPNFENLTSAYAESGGSGPQPWAVKSFSVSSWGGQTIKLQVIGNTGEVGFDDPAFNFTAAAVLGWSSPGSSQEHPSADDGEPVDTSAGSLVHRHTDILIPGRGIPLEFTRTYASMSTHAGDLGHRWNHNYAWLLTIESDGDATVTYPSGGLARFEWNSGSQTFSAPGGNTDSLVKNQDGTYTLTNTAQIKFNFSSAGKLTSIVDRNNNTTSLSYDGNGRLSSVTDPGGRALTFTYDASNRIWKVTDPLPTPDTRTVEFTYDASGDLTQVKDVKGGTTNYAYSSHRMISLTDSNNHTAAQNTYDTANRVAEQTDGVGGVTCFYYGSGPTYTSTNCPGVTPAPQAGETIVVNPRGNKTTYGFDLSYRTTDAKDPLGNTIHYDFDSSNDVTCVTDQRGKKAAYSYDSKGNVTQMIDALNTDASCQLKTGGVKWTFTYTARNDIDLETDPLGRQTDYVYDTPGNLTRVIRKDAGGAVKALTCFERDSAGLVTASVASTDLVVPPGPTDQCTGNRALLGYDSYGNQTCVVNPRFSSAQPCSSITTKSTFAFDNGGRLQSVTNELRQASGTAESGTQCGSAGTGNGLDDDADTVIDDGCPSAAYTYDAQNNVLATTDGVGDVTTNTYDAKGNLKTIIDANRKTVGTAESGTQCGAAGTGNGVDDDGDTVKDDGCPSSIYNYDNADRLTQVIDALGQSTTYGYDGNGNRTSVTTAKRQPVGAAETGTQCGASGTGNDIDDDADTVKDDGCPSNINAFDTLNRLQSTTDALARVTSYQYDAASNLTQRTDARGLVTKYFPDDANRLDLVEHWNGSTLVDSVDYTYNAVGFRTQMVDPTGTTTYTPDAMDRPTSITFPGPKTVSYTYDDLPGGSASDYPGQRTKITYPDSKTATYTYLADGSMSTVTDWLSKVTTYTYDNAGRLTKTQYPNTVWTDFTYDAADRLTSVVNRKTGPVTISSFTYTLDAVGNRTQMVDLSGTHTYQYDPLYRLGQVTYPGPTTDNYSYDAVGNRLTKNATSYTYDAADQMLTAAGVSYAYDANGNQTGRGTDTFTYDHENRLTQSVIGGVTSSSVYNGDGLRMSHTVSGQTTSYTWDVAGGLPVILQDSQGNTYVYGLDLISRTDSGGVQEYYLYDGLGSTTDLTDGSGNSIAGYGYDVFGAIRSQSGSSPNEFKFTGEQRDSESSLYYLRARYYDPGIGRFLTHDPLPGANLYAYVGNNPVNFVDPTGLQGTSDAALAACAAAAVYGGTAAAAGAETVVVPVGSAGGVAAVCLGGALIAVCVEGGCELVGDAIGALAEGVSDVAGKVGGFLGFRKEKPKPPIIIRYTDEDPVNVHQPRFDDFWGGKPPDWSKWWKRIVVGGGITWFAGHQTRLWQTLVDLLFDDVLYGEKPPRRP